MFDDWRVSKNCEFTRTIDGDLIVTGYAVVLIEGVIGGNLVLEDEAQVLLHGMVKKDVKIGRDAFFENKGFVGGRVLELEHEMSLSHMA